MNSLLDIPFISRVRRNHGLEHAVIHVLSERNKYRSLGGHSDTKGFWIFGDVGTEELADALVEALARMHAGERDLAVHPNCGTNYVTNGMVASAAAFVALAGSGNRTRDKLERLPLAGLFATIALIIFRPLGYRIQQRITTSGHPGDLEIVEVVRGSRGRLPAHRVTTRG